MIIFDESVNVLFVNVDVDVVVIAVVLVSVCVLVPFDKTNVFVSLTTGYIRLPNSFHIIAKLL